MFKRDISIISNAALDIAEKLNAIAIITFSEELAKTPTSIPVLVFKGGKLTMINHFAHYLDDKHLYEKMEDRARNCAEDISKASVIAFINNLIDAEGIVVGVMRMKNYDSIIVYDLSTNDIMKKLMSCAERAEPKVIKAVLNISLQIATEGREGKLFGTGFIIGDSDEVLRRSHQLLLNPFEGQPKKNRDIVN
ncbi:MAG TPA: hypothetical protein EYP80_02135, partial [Candidatus Aenigmarchaeota archaeon]|nr:hypothetical protein [Candidatus Aenigmarchaeota archaeon]